MTDFNLDSSIRRVLNFPKSGITFYDITSIIAEPQAFRHCIDGLKSHVAELGADTLAGVEARGFVFAAPLAVELGLPLLLLRKKGKLPGKVFSRKYSLEYGQDEICVHQADVVPDSKVLIIDDLIATGGTLRAAADMLTEAGAQVAGFSAVVGLPFLGYPELLQPYVVKTLIEYQGE